MQETEISSDYDHDALSFGGYQKKKRDVQKIWEHLTQWRTKATFIWVGILKRSKCVCGGEGMGYLVVGGKG